MALVTLKDLLYNVNTKLAGNMVDVELGQDDYEVAFNEALSVYRVHSVKSIKYGYAFINLEPGQTTYAIPETIDTIVEIHRTKAGYLPGSAQFEPFSAAFIQQTLGNGTGIAGGFQGLINYELAMGYQKLLERMLGNHIMFEHSRGKSEVMLWYTPKAQEVIALHCSQLKTAEELLQDNMVFRWLQDYTEAVARGILGEAYSLMSSIPGPQGGITLKGDALIAKSDQMKEKLVEDLREFVDGATGHSAPFWG